MGFRGGGLAAVAAADAAAALDAATNGIVPGSRLAADALDGKTITGANIRTAATGQRWEMDGGGVADRLQGFTGDPQETAPGGLFVSRGYTSGTGPTDRPYVALTAPVLNSGNPDPNPVLFGMGPTRDGTGSGYWQFAGDVRLASPKTTDSAATRGYVDGRLRRGITAVTADANGDATITHGLGTTPSAHALELIGFNGGTQFGKLVITNNNGLTFTVRLVDTRNGAGLAGWAYSISWTVFA